MRTALASALVALVGAAALAAPAAAATPTEKRLARQIKTMQRQIRVLQGQVRTLRRDVNEAEGVAAGALVFSVCSTVATADAFQGTWETIDRHAAHNAHGPDQYPAQTAIADPVNSCSLLELQRQPNVVPPTTNVFASLLNIFAGPASFARFQGFWE
jgi:hypothetical protein